MNKNPQEQGNAFFYILIAIALLAALTYSVSQSSRNNLSIIDEQQSKIAAQNIIEQGQTVSNAVQKLILRGFNETQISFENNIESGYDLAACTSSACKVFDINGGGLNWLYPPENANEGENWLYTGTYPIWGNGTLIRYDITMVLPNIVENVCKEINFKLGLVASNNDPILIPDDMSVWVYKLNSTFPIDQSPNYARGVGITGNLAACIRVNTFNGSYTGTNQNYYVHTIYAG